MNINKSLCDDFIYSAKKPSGKNNEEDSRLMEFRRGLLPAPKKQGFYTEEDLRKKYYTGKDYEIRLAYALIENDEFRKLFGSALSLYLYLRRYIVRGEMPGDKYNIKKNYYDKAFLACSFDYRTLSNKLHMSHHTIRRYLHKLEKRGVIKIDKHWVSEKYSINVFILGTWKLNNEIKSDIFYIDEKFGGVAE